ncbi:CvpA family protein [Planctomycetota bacterium]|nr:CvpA family protein [Planctomycetota bacterium]
MTDLTSEAIMVLAILQQASGAAGSTPGALDGTPWIDWVGLGIVVLFLILGIKHGLVWQMTRLLGMLLAVYIARTLSPELAPKFQSILNLSIQACEGIVWFLVFLSSLLVMAFIGMVGKRALEAVQLGPMDRLGGGMAGAVTGLVVHCVLLLMLTSLATADWASRTMRGSASATMLDNLSRKSHILLNAEAAETIVDPWGHVHDSHMQEADRQDLRRQQEDSRLREQRLRQQADEESRRRESQQSAARVK